MNCLKIVNKISPYDSKATARYLPRLLPFDWDISANITQSKTNGSYASVKEQSGLFAGDGGYHVKAKEVELKGGAIASTNPANSDLIAEKLSYSHVQSHMDYSASSVSLSGSVGGGDSGGATQSINDQFKGIGNMLRGDIPAMNTGSVVPTLPMSESGSDRSTTYATLTEGRIQVGGQSTTANALGINTDLAKANEGLQSLPNVQQLLSDQKVVSSAVGTITSSVTQAVSDKREYEQGQADKIRDQILSDAGASAIYNGLSKADKQAFLLANDDYRNAFNSAQKWSTGGDYKRAADVVTAIVTGIGSGQAGTQVAVNAVAPYAAQLIGNTFDPNKGGDHASATAQILSHAVLGAVLAYANGGNAITGAIAGGGSEAAAQYLVRELYPQAIKADGTFDASLLDETQRQNIVALTNGIGAVVGGLGAGVSGGDAISTIGNASVSAHVAQNAVENNYFSDQMVATFNAKTDLYKIVQGDPKSLAKLNMTPLQRERIMETFTKESHELNVSMIDVCSKGLSICGDLIAQAQRSQKWVADLKEYGFIRQNADFGSETAKAIQIASYYNQANKNALEIYNKPLNDLNDIQKETAFNYGSHSPKDIQKQIERLNLMSENRPGWSSSELKNDTKALTPKQKDKLDKLPVRATAAIALIPSAAEAVGGAVATAASVGDCIGGSHVVGCATTASGAAVTAQGIDNTWHSAQALWTGIPSVTWGERALQALGATPTQAALGYAAANIGSGAGLAKLYGINQVVKSENAALQAEIKAARIENGVNTDNDLLSTSLNREVFRGTISEISNHDVLYSILMRGKVQLKDGVTAENVFANVLQKPTGQRPNPNTYLSQQYIDKQLSKFDDGVVKIMGQQQYDKYGIAQTDGTSFVLPKSEVKQIIKSANGDANVISTKLGIPKEQLQNGQIIIVDIPITKTSNLRIPSGNEAGANSQWLPGGALPNGNAEAVIDARMIPSSSLKTTPLIIK